MTKEKWLKTIDLQVDVRIIILRKAFSSWIIKFDITVMTYGFSQTIFLKYIFQELIVGIILNQISSHDFST